VKQELYTSAVSLSDVKEVLLLSIQKKRNKFYYFFYFFVLGVIRCTSECQNC